MIQRIFFTFLLYNLFFNLSVYSQQEIDSPDLSVPTFNSSDVNLSTHAKLEDLKFKTQSFIAKNLNEDFVKKYFKPNDSIEFRFSFIIPKNGIIDKNKINVYTSLDFFNEEIIDIIFKLPKFTPAKASYNNEYYDYSTSYSTEFYIDENLKVVPIFRHKIYDKLVVNSGEKKILSIAKRLGYTSEYSFIPNKAYFSLSENKKITDVRIYSEDNELGITIKKIIDSLTINKIDFLKDLEASKNYTIQVDLIPNESFGDLTYLSIKAIPKKENSPQTLLYSKAEEAPIYPGCENEKENKDRISCMEKKIGKFISKKFNKRNLKGIHLKGILKVSTFFQINELGDIVNIKTRAPYPKLEQEAKRLISLLPKMIKPAFEKGKPVSVQYYLPIKYDANSSNGYIDPFKLDETPYLKN